MARAQADSAVDESGLAASMKHWIAVVGPFWARVSPVIWLYSSFWPWFWARSTWPRRSWRAPEFEAEVETALPEPELNRFEVGDTPIEPTVLDTESLTQLDPPKMEQTEKVYDDNPSFVEAGGGMASAQSNFGGLGGFSINALGAVQPCAGPVALAQVLVRATRAEPAATVRVLAAADKASVKPWSVASAVPSKPRRRGRGTELDCSASIQQRQLEPGAVHGRLQRRHLHRRRQGHQRYGRHGHGLVAVFGGGPNPYRQRTLSKVDLQRPDVDGRRQKSDGSLISGSGNMYSHGLAAICLCEGYGLTKDAKIGHAAQAAIKFIESAQNAEDGGWRYTPGQPGDTSVVGWQIMAMKSALMSGLQVDPKTMDGAAQILKLASAKSKNGGGFAYTPMPPPTSA